jgi:hypothetical protein
MGPELRLALGKKEISCPHKKLKHDLSPVRLKA